MMRSGLIPVTELGQLSDLVALMGADGRAVSPCDTPPSLSLWRVGEDATLLLEGPASQVLYVVRSGSLKCLKTLEDGYEQVLSLAQPGDLLGFEALHCGRQPVTAVALEDTTAYALNTRELPSLQRELPCPARCPATGPEPATAARRRNHRDDGRRGIGRATCALPAVDVLAHGRTRPVASPAAVAHVPA